MFECSSQFGSCFHRLRMPSPTIIAQATARGSIFGTQAWHIFQHYYRAHMQKDNRDACYNIIAHLYAKPQLDLRGSKDAWK